MRLSVMELFVFARVDTTYVNSQGGLMKPGCISIEELADKLEIDSAQLHRYRRDGGIPIFSCDKMAHKLHVHPGDIWTGWWDVEHGEVNE